MLPLKHCYQCGTNNPDQACCGTCGFPLDLSDYISKKVKDQFVETVKDRNLLEMDSSIKVFKQAWEWIRLILGIAIGLLVLTGAGVFWKVSDFWSSVDQTKQSVTDTAKKSSDEILKQTASLRSDIEGTHVQL